MAKYTDTELLDWFEETRHRREFVNTRVGYWCIHTDLSILSSNSVSIYLRDGRCGNEAVFHGNTVRQTLEELVDYMKLPKLGG